MNRRRVKGKGRSALQKLIFKIAETVCYNRDTPADDDYDEKKGIRDSFSHSSRFASSAFSCFGELTENVLIIITIF